MPTLEYDIEADWILLSTCNFRCIYCFWPYEALGRKIDTSDDRWKFVNNFFDNSGLIWLLHLTGGEPFLYPQFVELCQELTRVHFISINSNLDSVNVYRFAEVIDPSRVHFINCGLHIEEREKRKRVDDFIQKLHALRERGFAAFVTYVMSPEFFDRFPHDFAFFAERGIAVIPKVLQGVRESTRYPESYTKEEKSLFVEYSRRVETAYADTFAKMGVPPTINPFLDREIFLEGLPDYRGKLCNAGYSFVRIRENGDIRRCGRVDLLGNIFEGAFERRLGPSICQEIECPYFCHKYIISD